MTDQLDFAELKASGDLPSPKGVALTVMQLCQQDNISLTEVAHIIKGDPALAGRVIKVANTINPNKRRPIAAVSPETLIIIGTNAVQQIVLGFSLINQNQEGKCANFDYPYFWSHSIATAAATQAIGATARIAPPAEMFTCGLLASVGRIGLASARPEAYSEVLAKTRGMGNDALTAEETARFGMHHCELSHHMMSDWGLPRFYSEAVMFHEKPESAWFTPASRQSKLTWAIYLGALIADACLMTDDDARHALMGHICQIGEMLELDVVEMISIADQTAKEWLEWGELLKIDARPLPPFRPPDNTGLPVSTAGRVGGNLPLMRILVVDDEMITFIFSKMLGAAGHTVLTAHDGKSALEIAQKEQPHIIISDWLHPDFDGAALCMAVREVYPDRNIHFIMLTMQDEEHKRAEAERAGVNAYLLKPFNPDHIHAELQRAQGS